MHAWNEIVAGVSGRLTTSDLWSAAQSSLAAQGIDPAGTTIQDMNGLRAMANTMRLSEHLIGRADPGDVIGPDLIGRAPWSASLEAQAAGTTWEVRWEQVGVNEFGETETYWRTSEYTGTLPSTLEDLYADLDAEGADTEDRYGISHAG